MAAAPRGRAAENWAYDENARSIPNSRRSARAPRGRNQIGVPPARQDSTIPTRTRIPRRRTNSPRSIRPTRSSATRRSARAFDRGEIDAEGKPRHPGFEGFGGARPAARAGAAAAPASSISNSISATASPNAAGPAAASIPTFSPNCSAAAGAAAPRGRSGARMSRVVATVPLALAATGGSARVTLPTGKTLEVAVPVGVEDGKQIRLRGQGQPGASSGPAGDALVTVRYAPHPLVQGRRARPAARPADRALRGGARRQGARADARRRGRNDHSAGTSSGRTLRLRGKGLPAAGEARRAICW